MTIALGILADDGVVIAADTELSWGDARKTEGAKIAVLEDHGLAIAGAGHGGYIDALSHDLQRTIARVKTNNLSVIARSLQSTLAKFHRDHVQPWRDPNLDVWMIVGLERAGKLALWVTEKTTLRPCICAAIGAGSAEAEALFTQFFGVRKRPTMDVVTARAIAAYVAHVAKDRIPGCGKNTDIVLIGKGKAEQLSRTDVLMLDDQINELIELQIRAAQFALGYIKISDEQEAAAHLTKFFQTSRSHFVDAGWRQESARWTLGDPAIESQLLSAPTPPQRTRVGRPIRPRSTHGRKPQPPSQE